MPYSPQGVDPFSIPRPDPTRHYRWLSDDPRRLALWLRQHGDHPGYQLVTPEEGEAIGLGADYVNLATGRIRYGFNVLASIPIEEYHRRVRERLDEQLDRQQAAREGFLASTDHIKGVDAFIREPAEHFDRKEHATRPSNNRTFVSTNQRNHRRDRADGNN